MSTENYRANVQYEYAAAYYFLLNGCKVRKATLDEDVKFKFDIEVEDGTNKILDSGIHRIDVKNLHWALRFYDGSLSVYFELNKHAGLKLDFHPTTNNDFCDLRVIENKSTATDILFGLANTNWQKCLLVKRLDLVDYVKSHLQTLHLSRGKSTRDTLVWLPLTEVENLSYRSFDMSQAVEQICK